MLAMPQRAGPLILGASGPDRGGPAPAARGEVLAGSPYGDVQVRVSQASGLGVAALGRAATTVSGPGSAGRAAGRDRQRARRHGGRHLGRPPWISERPADVMVRAVPGTRAPQGELVALPADRRDP